MSELYAWEKVWSKGRYSTDAARLLKASRKFVAFEAMGSIPKNFGNTVEIGCGNSAFIKLAVDRGKNFENYLGIDKSPAALIRARANTTEFKNCTFINGDAIEIPVKSSSVDTIISLGVLEHVLHVADYVQELRRIAAPGARLLISTSNTKSAMYGARRTREIIGAWPYGFQRNDSFTSITNILKPHFNIKSLKVLHGDRDFIFSTAIDKAIGLVSPRWGRYILCESVAS